MPTFRPRLKPFIKSGAELWALPGMALVLLFFVLSGAIAHLNIQSVRVTTQQITHTHEVIVGLDELLSAAQDAETGQRGYLLTGDDAYLQPYLDAVDVIATRLARIATLTQDNPVQQSNLAQLKRSLETKMRELKKSIDFRSAGEVDAALALVNSGRGKAEMDAIRVRYESMRSEEGRLRQIRLDDLDRALATAVASGLLSGLLGAGLTVAVYALVRRSARARDRQDWLQSGQVGLADALAGDKNVEQLSESVLTYLSSYVDCQAGAIFKGHGGTYDRVATLGVPADASIASRFKTGEGLLGQVAAEGRMTVLQDIPDGYLTFGSALGRDKPRHLLIMPALADRNVNAVIELGFLKPVEAQVSELLERSAASIGVALRSARYRAQLQNALDETQRQAEELQAQSEELRVSNEELEEQGRALKESQTRLEQQQAELEQNNSQLEEQAQTLEQQRDQLERTNASVELKARELSEASRYKSDFLANMSHELRTPLNSLLILSKLLGDNPDGNLSTDQVQYARTIESAGNDLLSLINDILDLSKIEAGHLQIQPETVTLQRIARDLRQVFQPVAHQRKLQFAIDIDDDAPDTVVTDRQRLAQVLKNLLSNAFKFTERGSVRLTMTPSGSDALKLAVIDTGIGIAADQRDAIFDAFRQADSTISRRFGGTGLGLSISRELTRLLGGRIQLDSQPGAGSTFTVIIPHVYQPAKVANRQPAPAASVRAPQTLPPPLTPAASTERSVRTVDGDLSARASHRRRLLIVEDDPNFAMIVRDVSRELGFECVVAGTAEEAMDLARSFDPHAIVLDIGLPDQSGLTVLDRLKHDVATRHIPIHVVSAADASQTALALGAVGYLVKPVRHEQLAEVLQNLESQLTRTVRRVLIVEDDAVQREAVGKLLASGDVQTVGVGTAAECLAQLAQQTFDCMVLDLSLPDASGYALLETLSAGGHAFPPVIVYTGRELSLDEEQRLRRYSSSIIIKGAKSPERLLDEVSLFLHQVVSDLPAERRNMIHKARHRDAALEGRRILIVEDDVRNVYSLSSVLEPRGAKVEIARNGQEAIDALTKAADDPLRAIDLVLMDVMMPVMDGLTATRQIRLDPRFTALPIVMLTAKAMPDDQERCIQAGASDYMAKPVDVDRLLSLVRVWMPR